MIMDNNTTLTKKIYAENGSNVSICIKINNAREDTEKRIEMEAEYFASLVSGILERNDHKENPEVITLGSEVCHELKSFDEHRIVKAVAQGFMEAFMQETERKKNRLSLKRRQYNVMLDNIVRYSLLKRNKELPWKIIKAKWYIKNILKVFIYSIATFSAISAYVFLVWRIGKYAITVLNGY